MAANHGNGGELAWSNGRRKTIISTRLAPPRCLSAVMDHLIQHTKHQLKRVVVMLSFTHGQPRGMRDIRAHACLTRVTSVMVLVLVLIAAIFLPPRFIQRISAQDIWDTPILSRGWDERVLMAWYAFSIIEIHVPGPKIFPCNPPQPRETTRAHGMLWKMNNQPRSILAP